MKNFSKRILTGGRLFSLKSTLMLLALSFFTPNVSAIEEKLEIFAQQLMEGLQGPLKIAVQPINKKEADLPAGTTLILEEQVSNAVQMAAFSRRILRTARERGCRCAGVVGGYSHQRNDRSYVWSCHWCTG